MKNKCVDCNEKISKDRIRCEECWTLGFADDLGLDIEEMLAMAKTKKGIYSIAKLFMQKVDEVNK
jgi:hypothetical protein